MNHEKVVSRFANRVENPKIGSVTWSGSRIWCDGDTIYSYGTHFPMAYYLGEANGQSCFIKNGDRYSSTTSGHQSIVQRDCKGPTVSRTSLSAAGINMCNLQLPSDDMDPHKDVVVDWTQDRMDYIYRVKDKETGEFLPGFYEGGYCEYMDGSQVSYSVPKQGMFIPYAHQESEDEIQEGYWHVLGAVLIRTRENKCFLSSLDDRRYFVAELSKAARTVTQAFRGLKPRPVREAERSGLKVVRQGEWFFVPTPYEGYRAIADLFHIRTIKETKEKAQVRVLPYRPEQRHRHVCRGLVRGQTIYVCGRVKHVDEDGYSTGEHPQVKLGDRWYRAYRNTEIQSWSQSGSFD